MTDRLHLPQRYRRILEALLREHVPDAEVWAYGSRITGESHEGSDLDLVARGPELKPLGDGFFELLEAIESSNIPILVQAHDWARLPESFHAEIERDYVVVQAGAKMTDMGVFEDWREVRLGECSVINDSTYSPKEAWPVINYLDTGNISENRVSDIQKLTVGRDKIPSRARRKVQPGDVVYSTVRPNQRHYGLLKTVPENFLASTGFAVLRGKEGIADTGFLYCFLTQKQIVDYLHSIAENSTSAYPSIRPGDLEQLTLRLPALSEQRSIAHVLGRLDDKIELNRRMNETLEEMARALFKSWFVDFDPVRAKAALRTLPADGSDWTIERARAYLDSMDKDIVDLFPDRLVDWELGKIPEGWEVKAFSDCVEVARGLSYKGSGLSTDGIPMHNLNSVNEGGGYKYEGIKYYRGDYQQRHVALPGDVLVANTEQGHDRLLIGFAAIIPVGFGERSLFSHHLYRVRPKRGSRISPEFFCQLVNTQEMQNIVSGYATGTTVNMLPLDALRIPNTVIPPTSLVNAFSAFAQIARSRQKKCIDESRALAAQRDELLPKLVTGTVRIG